MANPTPKTYQYHVYKNGVFKGLLTNVITDFGKQQEINSTGSAVTIQLGVAADNYSEGSLIDFNNQVKVYVVDDEVPNGSLLFTGYIMNYKPIFTNNNQELVELTVVGYGATLNDYLFEAIETLDVNQQSDAGIYAVIHGSNPKSSAFTNVIQSFTVGNGVTKLSSIVAKLQALTNYDVGSSIDCQVFSSQSDAEVSGGSSLIASAATVMTSQTATAIRFSFANPVNVTAGNRYWAVFSYSQPSGFVANYDGQAGIYYDSAKPLAAETLETVSFNGASWGAPSTINGSIYIQTYQASGTTQTTYNNYDPSNILKSIMDAYAAQGGPITYTGPSIDLTGTTVNYTFNCQTIFEAINKCLDLAPPGWYWYIDEANNVLHFHKVSTSAQHSLTLGKNISSLSIEKRIQDLVNIVYFIGGPTGGINLYKKFTLQQSVDLYGRHGLRYTDNNVLDSATATTIANSILTNRSQVELRIDLEILDNGGDVNSILGFNLEAIVLGESVTFRSFGSSSGATLWDVARWDVAKWDFDITDITSVIVQVTKIDYSPSILKLSLSTVPPDVTKRVEYLYRGLVQTQVLANPSAPS